MPQVTEERLGPSNTMLAVRRYRVHNLVAANADALAFTFNQGLPYTDLHIRPHLSSTGWRQIDKPSEGDVSRLPSLPKDP